MHVLLDTNIYLADISLKKPEFEALRNYLSTARSRLLMPHIVEAEIEKNIDSRSQAEISKLSDSFSLSLGLVASIPTKEQLANSMKNQLRTALRRNHLTKIGYGDLTLEQITERSLLETPPFKTNGRGFRDALIWYSLLQYLGANPSEEVAFISNNSQDFGFGELKAELLHELDSLGFQARVKYYKSLNDFLSKHSEPIAFITDSYVEENVINDIEGYADSISEEELDIDFPNSEAEWKVASIDFEYGEIENYYIYRTTEEHYFLLVDVNMHFNVSLEGFVQEWDFDHYQSKWDWVTRTLTDYTDAYYSCDFELRIDKISHEAEVIG